MDEPAAGTHQLSAPPVCLQLPSELWAGTIGAGDRSRVHADGTVVLRVPATLPGVTLVRILEEGRDAGHREDTLDGVATVHK
jgi:hypothetical protein